jgi:hypothetical protein
LGGQAFKRGAYKIAARYYAQQVGFATQENQDCEQGRGANEKVDACKALAPQPFNNVALATLRAGEPLKAKAWLSWAPNARITDHNKILVDHALASFHWPDSPEGEYWMYAGYGLWSTISVRRNGDRFDISFEGYHFPSAGLNSGPDSGSLDEIVPIVDGVAVLHGDEDSPQCTITSRFKSDQVDLDEQGNCAFGANVSASGTYVRVSTDAVNGDL